MVTNTATKPRTVSVSDAATAPAITPRAVSVADAAKALGIGVTHAWRLISDGKIRAARLGGRTLVPVPELDRVISEAQAGHR